jgi:hypothetical protein
VRSSRSSLDSATKLRRARIARDGQPIWVLVLYPGAGEAGGSLRLEGPSLRGRYRDEPIPECEDFGDGPAVGEWEPWAGREPETDATAKAERSAREAAKRARGRVRRYCAENALNRLGTLTYRPPFCRDPWAVREHVGAFFERLRRRVGGPFPYLWVPELHADGERYHLHFAVGRYVPRGWIVDSWPHGFVHIKLIGDLPTGSGSWGEARVAARYLAKYVAKGVAGGPAGLHRYEVAEGFQPERRRLYGLTVDDVLEQASEVMGSEPELVWSSSQDSEWAGPPAVWASWAR